MEIPIDRIVIGERTRERIEAVIAARAKERQIATLKQNRCADSAQRSEPEGRTRDLVAQAVGLGRTKLAEARQAAPALTAVPTGNLSGAKR